MDTGAKMTHSANSSALPSPRTMAASSSSIHRPWEMQDTPSSSSSSTASMVFAFPSPVSSQSAPATPSGLHHQKHLFTSRNMPHLLHPSPLFSPFYGIPTGSDGVNNLPTSPCLSTTNGTPFSPFGFASFGLGHPYSTPLPSMPFSAPSCSSSSLSHSANSVRCSTPSSPVTNVPPRTTISAANSSPSAIKTDSHMPCPPKKKRKPPPISIDSRISNFSTEAAEFQNMMSMLSPTMTSAPLPSPLLSAQFQQYHDQQHLNNALRFMCEGPLTPAMPSSGYGSVDGQMLFSPLNFAFLCFFPGTKVKFMCAEDSPSLYQWNPVEVFRENNASPNLGTGIRLVSTVRSNDNDPSHAVELTFRTLEPPGTPDKAAIHIKALVAASHPFYDLAKGWSSFDPQSTHDLYGIQCSLLRLGDIVATRPPDRVEFAGWNHCDANASRIAEWSARNRRAVSMESLAMDPRAGWTLTTQMPTTPRETKPRVKKEKKEKKDDKAKRPMNAFMLFAQRYRVHYTQRFPGRDNRAISCLLGDHWKSLNSDERQKFTDEAKNLAELYKEKNPDCWKRRSRSGSETETQLIVVDDSMQPRPLPLSPVEQDRRSELSDQPEDYSRRSQTSVKTETMDP